MTASFWQWPIALFTYFVTWEYYRKRISRVDLGIVWVCALGTYLIFSFSWFTLAVLSLWLWRLIVDLKRSRVG